MNVILIGKGNLGKAFLDYASLHNELVIVDALDEKLDIKEYHNIDAIIDFSSPSAITTSLNLALKYKAKLIIGTTGYDNNQLELINAFKDKLVICKANNYSLGFHIFKRMCYILDSLNLNYDKYVIETHQKHKLDTPSGSSLELNANNIFSLRGSSVNGVHEVRIFLDNESLSLKHEIHSRETFVNGVIKMLDYLKDKEVGLYTFDDYVKELFNGL